MKKYSFRKDSPYRDEEAQSVGEFLSKHFPDENLTPKEVVELARPINSPIHKFFDWDDTSAAEKFRLGQARGLIAALFVIVDDKQVKAYETVRFTPSENLSYVTTEKIFRTEDLTDQVIENAKRELLYWEQKYSLYKNKLPYIFQAIQKLKEEQAHGKKGKAKTGRRATNKHSTDRRKDRDNNSKRGYASTGK